MDPTAAPRVLGLNCNHNHICVITLAGPYGISLCMAWTQVPLDPTVSPAYGHGPYGISLRMAWTQILWILRYLPEYGRGPYGIFQCMAWTQTFWILRYPLRMAVDRVRGSYGMPYVANEISSPSLTRFGSSLHASSDRRTHA